MVLLFRCQLTHVVLEKRPLNECSSSSSSSSSQLVDRKEQHSLDDFPQASSNVLMLLVGKLEQHLICKKKPRTNYPIGSLLQDAAQPGVMLIKEEQLN